MTSTWGTTWGPSATGWPTSTSTTPSTASWTCTPSPWTSTRTSSRARTYETALDLLAAGLDPERCTLFVQSHVAEHAQLAWLLECTATMGELRRMTQFKDKSAGKDSVRVGLFTYPVLQSADILLYDAERVPVGDDQRQHLELARELAHRFNHRYGPTLVVPEAAIPAMAARVMDLQHPGQKMSKSVNSPLGTVLMLDDPADIERKVKKAVTDTDGEVRYDPEAKPGLSNLHRAAGRGHRPHHPATWPAPTERYGDLKTDVAEALIELLRPVRERRAALAADPGAVPALLAAGGRQGPPGGVGAPTAAPPRRSDCWLPGRPGSRVRASGSARRPSVTPPCLAGPMALVMADRSEGNGTRVRRLTGPGSAGPVSGSGSAPGSGSGSVSASGSGSVPDRGPDRGAAAEAPVGTAELESAIDTLARFVAGFEPGRFSGEDASVLVSWFTRCERLAGTAKALAASRASRAHRPEAGGHPTPAHWLSGLTGESLGESTGVLRLGDHLARHAAVDEAARAGELSRQAARLVADAVSVNPDREEDLVEAARGGSMRQLKDRCLRAKAEARSAEDAEAAHRALHDARHCRTFTDRDGAFCLDARLTPEAGAALLAALTPATDRYFHRARRSGHHEPTDAYRADALVALVTGARATGPGPTDGSGPRTADGPRAQVTLRVDLDALRTGVVGPDGVCEIPGVGPVPLATARALLGDAVTRLVITNGIDVTTVCHLGRSIPAALKAALVERDRCCVVPGCDVDQGLEIDHWGIPFAEGGAATLANLARLCGHHHALRTHRGFTLTGGPGRWQWTPPKDRPPEATDDDDHDQDQDDTRLFSLDE